MEPGAGDGAIIRAVDDWRDLKRLPPVWWRAVEVNPVHRRALERSLFRGAGELLVEDFFARPHGQWDCIIGNPAFHLSERYLSVCLPLAPVVCFLEKLNFLGAQRRADFWRAHPADVYVLSDRPFPDMTEYAWFVWGQCGPGPGRIRVLGPDDSQLPLLPVPKSEKPDPLIFGK